MNELKCKEDKEAGDPVWINMTGEAMNYPHQNFILSYPFGFVNFTPIYSIDSGEPASNAKTRSKVGEFFYALSLAMRGYFDFADCYFRLAFWPNSKNYPIVRTNNKFLIFIFKVSDDLRNHLFPGHEFKRDYVVGRP